MEAPPTHYAQNGDVNIAYKVLGDGPVDLLWVSGFVSNIELYWEIPAIRRFVERLAGFSRLILFDKRSQGASDRFPDPPTLEETMEDALAVLDAAGSTRAHLFGVSEGGPMSILMAASAPERIASLTLYGTYARLTKADDYDPGIPQEVFDSFMVRLKESWGDPDSLKLFAPTAVSDEEFRQGWGRFLRTGISPNGAQALLRLYQDIDVRHVLPSLHVPTLVIHRTGDKIAAVGMGRYIADHIPGARFVELPSDDHLPMIGDSDAILDEFEEFVTGQRPQREPDRVLATVMFTDIVGSTEKAAAMGDHDWRELIERHDLLMREQVERHRGRTIKTMGDGVLATFDGPARAIRCACEARDAVEPLGVDIRAGLHTGECELIGDDVGGIAVNIGARVGAEAGPGEVLVSRTVTDLVAGSGIEFEPRGSHALKGVPGEWELYAVS